MRQTPALCLACSSSPPPKSAGAQDIFLTSCCNRPICANCLRSNPRLARYDPCLACLGGVAAVSAHASRRSDLKKDGGNYGELMNRSREVNIDGAVRDADVFVLGDDDEDEGEDGGRAVPDDSGGGGAACVRPGSRTPPPAYSSDGGGSNPGSTRAASAELPSSSDVKPTGSAPPSGKFYLSKGDTLLGIALKCGVDGRTLCRMNNLPASTLTTTPHLLHTRTFIVLPPSSKPIVASSSLTAEEDLEHEARRARERAEKRFQFVTKEVDWRVAKADVALADDPNGGDVDAYAVKRKEAGMLVNGSTEGNGMEDRAVDQYLDDEEWEARERASGRAARIQPVPGSSRSTGKGKVSNPGPLAGLLFRRKD